jgi:hypothetical protein
MNKYQVELRVIVEVMAEDEHEAYTVAMDSAVNYYDHRADIVDTEGLVADLLACYCEVCGHGEVDEDLDPQVCAECHAEMEEIASCDDENQEDQ